MTNILLEVTSFSLTISGQLGSSSFRFTPTPYSRIFARITSSFPSRSIADPSLEKLLDACCSVWPRSAIDDGLVCYGFRRAQVGRADTRDYLLCGQIGSFRTRQRGPLYMYGQGSTRHGNITAIRSAIRRCDITFNFVSTRDKGGRKPMIG